MKVIVKDNFDRDYISDYLYKENVTREEGDKICKEKNKYDQQQDFYVVVEDDHKLYEADF